MCKIVYMLDVVAMLDITGRISDFMEEKEFLTTDEAIAFLGISRPTLFRMIKEFNIQVYTLVGKANYYKRSDLQKIKEHP
jgi:excisionase family DNA binding protein